MVVGDRRAGGDVVGGAHAVRLGGAVVRPHEHPQGELRPGGERGGLLDGRREQLVGRHHLADQPELQGRLGVDHARPQHEVEGPKRSVPLPSRASLDANRRSHARASESPLCTAAPLTAAMVGLSTARRARLSACEYIFSALYVDPASRCPPSIIGTLPGCSLV
jgi:hypothetical protein